MLDTFFITGELPAGEHGSYSLPLVALSYIIASLASYLALVLARRLAVPEDRTRHRSWVYAGGSLALGAGIWSMHFIGMLAYKMDMPMAYDPWLTLLSLAVAVASAFGVLYLVGRQQLRLWQIMVGAVILGFGISGMHYIGMEAMIMPAEIRYLPGIFALSILIAIAASGAALWLCFRIARHGGRKRYLLEIAAALVMGAAICGMHYTGMAAAVFLPHEHMHHTGNTRSNGIELIIAAIGVILCLVTPVTIYREVKEEDNQDQTVSAFPAKLMAASIFGSLSTFLAVIGYSLYSSDRLQKAADIQQAITDLHYIAYGTAIVALLIIPAKYFSLYSIRIWREQLRSNKRLLDTIIDNMPLALFAKDATDGYRWALWNKAAERMFGLKQANVLGHTDYDFFPKEEADFFRQTDENVMAGGRLVDIEAEPVTTATGTFTSHTIKMPIYDANGKPHLLLGMSEDVTERIKAKEDLRIAKERAEQSDQTKSEFLANMSHELRTPLNSILGMTRLLLGSDMKDSHKETLKTVYQSSTQLLELVNDILDLSKIEANQVELEHIGFDPAYTVESTVAALRQIAEEKRLKLMVESDQLPFVLGDPTRLSRIFINLIGNGIKYTDKGSVTVKVSCAPLADGRVQLLFDVQDTGIGIPPEKLETIFNKFVQADTSTTRRYGGTGLGLAITKQLVELMGGTIAVESQPGSGSTFSVRIPFTTTTTLEERPSLKRAKMLCGTLTPEKARILIAEDHAMNKIFMARLMQDFGLTRFEIFDNGQLAVEAYQREGWDIILMDCHMPEMNGYEATETIRALEKSSGKHVPIIAMTANAMVGDREKCLRYGMDDYISKPINHDELKSILSQWIRFEDSAAPPAVSLPPVAARHIDLSILRTFTEDKDLLRQLANSFFIQSDKNVADLHQHCIAGESKPWTEAGHMLKGGARQIGAEHLGDLCHQAQEMLIASLDEREALLHQIKEEYALVKVELKAELEA